MKTIETTATVNEDGTMTVQIPPDISHGEYRVVVVIDEQVARKEKRPSVEFPVMSVGSWPENLSLRREDMYDEWGR